MTTNNKNPFVSFANAYCGLVANQLSDLSMQFDKAVTQSNALFNELALRGEAVETNIKNSRRFQVSNPIKSLLDSFNFGTAKRDKQLEQLSNKVDALVDAVALLAEKKALEKQAAAKAAAAKPKPKAKPAAAKAQTAKTAASTAKSSASKPATRKPRTTKSAAGKSTPKSAS